MRGNISKMATIDLTLDSSDDDDDLIIDLVNSSSASSSSKAPPAKRAKTWGKARAFTSGGDSSSARSSTSTSTSTSSSSSSSDNGQGGSSVTKHNVWTCLLCTFINEGSTRACALCLADRKEDLVDFECDDEDNDDEDDDIMVVDASVARGSTFDDMENNGLKEEGDDLVMIGVNNANSLGDYPHSRHDCPVKPFTTGDTEKNKLYCENCYCYVCDEKASTCSVWFEHCCAYNDKGGTWSRKRQQKKYKFQDLKYL